MCSEALPAPQLNPGELSANPVELNLIFPFPLTILIKRIQMEWEPQLELIGFTKHICISSPSIGGTK